MLKICKYLNSLVKTLVTLFILGSALSSSAYSSSIYKRNTLSVVKNQLWLFGVDSHIDMSNPISLAESIELNSDQETEEEYLPEELIYPIYHL